jgi:murein tripeptide amidase MpaA
MPYRSISWKSRLALATLSGAFLLLGPSAALAKNEELQTTAEKTQFKKTGRYQEAVDLCQAFARRWPERVRVETFGRTPEGRPMVALIASCANHLTPDDCRKTSTPVFLMQGGIHAGEIDGKDAGFIAMRELVENHSPMLEKATVVFVPVFNIDGHERFGAYNRPNQVGPEEMGWRVTGQNLNLNRDYAKADAPEMHSMLKLLNRWDPIVYADLHVTDGSHFQPDIAVLVEPIFIGDPGLHASAHQLQDETVRLLKQQGSMPLPFYPSLKDPNNPDEGFADSAYTPRFSTGYWPLRNRLAVLIETHSWKDYPTRVKATKNSIIDMLFMVASEGKQWIQKAKQADLKASQLGGTNVTLSYQTGPHSKTIQFPGYAYQKEVSSISGGKVVVYDQTNPQIWSIPFYDEVLPKLIVRAPKGGYIVPAAYANWIKPRLERHGISFRPIKSGRNATVEAFRADKVTLSERSFEGHHTAQWSGEWKSETRPVEAGSLYIPIAQPAARLIMALLEPQAPDSYASWGFFNIHAEQREYMEDYVAEQVARDMLSKDPALKKRFEAQIASDQEFAKSPQARWDFFYKLHPSWDERFRLYPIVKTEQVSF